MGAEENDGDSGDENKENEEGSDQGKEDCVERSWNMLRICKK